MLSMQGTSESGRTVEVAWVNGREGYDVSVLERGLHYGDGLFETIACLGGEPRFLERHLARLGGGCARLHIPLADTAELSREVRALAADTARAIVKVLVTRGAAVTRGYAPTGAEHATRITLRYGWPADDPLLAERGVRVRIATLRLGENPALAGLKHCNRLEQVLARAEWNDADVSESLMFSSSGALVAGTMSNVFLVKDATLLTPRLDRCGVAGVMRAVVLAAAAAAGIPAEERLLAAEDLAAAHEIFLTSALIGIRPVRELQGVPLAVGRVTRRLQAALAPLLARTAAISASSRA
jgi:4-amino-4-deoxychorismate lyase